jgi:hypothetical protein
MTNSRTCIIAYKAEPTSPNCGLLSNSEIFFILKRIAKPCRSQAVSGAVLIPSWEIRRIFFLLPFPTNLLSTYTTGVCTWTHTHTHSYNPGGLFLWVRIESSTGDGRGEGHSPLLWNCHLLILGYLHTCLETVECWDGLAVPKEKRLLNQPIQHAIH